MPVPFLGRGRPDSDEPATPSPCWGVPTPFHYGDCRPASHGRPGIRARRMAASGGFANNRDVGPDQPTAGCAGGYEQAAD
jgi:hypothetical protein